MVELGGWGVEFVGHCHSITHEYDTIQIFKFEYEAIQIFKFPGGGIEAGGGGEFQGPLCMKPCCIWLT